MANLPPSSFIISTNVNSIFITKINQYYKNSYIDSYIYFIEKYVFQKVNVSYNNLEIDDESKVIEVRVKSLQSTPVPDITLLHEKDPNIFKNKTHVRVISDSKKYFVYSISKPYEYMIIRTPKLKDENVFVGKVSIQKTHLYDSDTLTRLSFISKEDKSDEIYTLSPKEEESMKQELEKDRRAVGAAVGQFLFKSKTKKSKSKTKKSKTKKSKTKKSKTKKSKSKNL